MKVLHLYLIFLIALFSVSCNNSKGKEASQGNLSQSKSDVLKVAVMPTLDCLPLYLAQEWGLFHTDSLDVKLLLYTAQMDCDTAVLRGHVDVVVTDLVRAERMKNQGLNLQYLTSTNLFWQLISNRSARIKTIKQLGDKMVAVTRFSGTDYLLTALVDSSKLKNEVFHIQINDINIRLKMLLNNEIDAAFFPEPQATMARKNNHYMLLDTRDKQVELGVIAFNSKKVGSKRKRMLLNTFVKAYSQACDSLNANGIQPYRDILKKYYQLDDKVIQMLPNLKYKKVAMPRENDIQRAKQF